MTIRPRIYKTTSDLQAEDIRRLYTHFNSPIANLDCGQKCAPHNPSGKPFCCDICHAVPAAYKSEWSYLQDNTQLWHEWCGDECGTTTRERAQLKADTPKNMVLLACLGPTRCEREHRALSCRQFPFFPYVTSDFRFIGLACEWEFQNKCWVISNLTQVTQKYREEFITAYDELFALFQSEFDSYAYHSEMLRTEFSHRKKRFPLLHRNGNDYLVSPASERIQRVPAERLPQFHPYR
jgi:hypothetical protein